jgi:rod shape determining protein RodA
MSLKLRELTQWDFLLIGLLLPILAFSLTALYSIGLSREEGDLLFFRKQLVFITLGVAIMIIAGLSDFRSLKSYSRLVFIASILLLIGVLFFGKTIRGTTGWFVFGPYQFQPIEMVKVLLIICLGSFFSDADRPLASTKNILRSFFIFLPIFILTILQPDLGSALLLAFIWFSYLILLRLSWRQGGVFLVLTIVAAVLGWFFVLQDYQKDRIRSFLNPSIDTLGDSYAVTQSIVAIGSGRWAGSGLGFGSQSQLKFLPESHTDFIFSVIAEELGFIGVFILLTFVVLFLLRLVQMCTRIRDDFGVFFLIGTALLFSIQMFLNLSVTLGFMPVTGLPFPFLSYGGSSLIMSFLIIGIVQSIWSRAKHS